MKTKLDNEESSENTNNTKRFILLVLLPSLIVLFTLGYFYSLGRFITTENAYIKAPIISIQSEISGRIDQVYIKNNQKIQVLSVAPLMAEAIKRISNSTSVSDLFN